MKPFLSFAFLSLLLFADTVAAARKDVGEYWRAVKKDQPMPEALKGLVRIDATSTGTNEKTTHHTPASFELKEEKIVVEDSERAIRSKGDEKKSTFTNDFEPKPNISAYGDDANLKGKKTTSFAGDFELGPNITSYGDDDAGLKREKKSFTSDFEQKPNIFVYYD